MPNLFADLPAKTDEELFSDLLKRPGVRIERIISTGQPSPPGHWYDQDWDEWVVLLAGSAGLVIEGKPEIVLEPGDYVFLPAHRRHRVSWTDAGSPTVWLAIHIGEPDRNPSGDSR